MLLFLDYCCQTPIVRRKMLFKKVTCPSSNVYPAQLAPCFYECGNVCVHSFMCVCVFWLGLFAHSGLGIFKLKESVLAPMFISLLSRTTVLTTQLGLTSFDTWVIYILPLIFFVLVVWSLYMIQR